MKRRYQPWAKGPADIIPFPHRALRAWVVAPALGEPGHYFGSLVGAPVDGPQRTAAGALADVIRRVTDHDVRCGLPVLVRDKSGPVELLPRRRRVGYAA